MKEKTFRYEQVAAKIEESIKNLRLQPGDKIASVRKVSQDLKVSLNTVYQAYSILDAKGLIIAKPRSGYVVNVLPNSLKPSQSKRKLTLPAAVDNTEMATAMMKNAKEYGIFNFSILAPVNEHLPITKLNKLVASSLYETRNDNYQYPLVDGHPRLLKQIVIKTFDWMHPIDHDKIMVTNGCMEAINLCSRLCWH